MKTLILSLILLAPILSDAQITSAEERMRRQSNNSRVALTMDDVIAQHIDIGDRAFNFRFQLCSISKLRQLDANRWEVEIAGSNGLYAGMAHFPRAGAEAIHTIQDGDIVIARVKPGSGGSIVEILGVSATNVWQ